MGGWNLAEVGEVLGPVPVNTNDRDGDDELVYLRDNEDPEKSAETVPVIDGERWLAIETIGRAATGKVDDRRLRRHALEELEAEAAR